MANRMDMYKCEKCGKMFDEFEMNYRNAQIDKRCLCSSCRDNQPQPDKPDTDKSCENCKFENLLSESRSHSTCTQCYGFAHWQPKPKPEAVKPDTEKGCNNCQFGDLNGDEFPCKICFEDTGGFTLWQPEKKPKWDAKTIDYFIEQCDKLMYPDTNDMARVISMAEIKQIADEMIDNKTCPHCFTKEMTKK